MSLFLWLIYIFLAVLTIFPLARMDLFKVSRKYKYFKHLSLTLFFWTVIIGLRFVSSSPSIIYFASLTVYPLVFALTSFIFMSMVQYLGKKVPKFFLYFLILFFIIDATLSYTNSFHQLLKQVTYDSTVTNDIMSLANHGLFFFIHTAVCYSILVISMITVSFKLYKNLRKDGDYAPFLVIILFIILGIGANIIHLYIIEFSIDPTYIAIVILLTLMYQIFLMRDLKLILKTSGNEYILDNLREMYLLVNQRGKIVSASNELINKFSLNIDEELSFEDFKEIISDKAFIYTETSKIDNDYDENKIFLHMLEKQINLPLLKRPASFYLFYDESQIQKYIHELNYVMTHDLMTKVYNRNYLENLEAEIEANYENYSVVVFDLDGLKLFNDYLGHEAGDQLLIHFAEALKEVVKKHDNLTAIRMGGDEFLLIAPNKDMNDIEELIYDLKVLTSDKDPLKHIGFSYGYAQNINGSKAFKKVMTEADAKQCMMKISKRKSKDKLEESLKALDNF